MDQKSYLQLAGAIFALVALAHLVRAVLGLPIVIAGWIVPIWLSWLAFVIAGALSWFGWSLAKRAET
jgi:cytochrome c biogenesis protein CcdA